MATNDMLIPLRTIADLLQIVDGAPDESGTLASVARVLAPIDCECLFLADAEGRVIIAEGKPPGRGANGVARLARRVAQRLQEAADCHYRMRHYEGDRGVFGARVAEGESYFIVGGCYQPRPKKKLNLKRRLRALIACADLAHRLVQLDSEQRKVRVENRHLRAEHCTLKAAHTEATIEAVREREERLALEGERIALEQFLRAAEKANASKSDFLASVAHEIRTPMTAILGFTEVLQQEAQDAHQADALQTIKKNGEYLLDIINDVLDIAKIEAGKLEVDRIPCSPLAILDDVVALMQSRAEAKGLSLTTEVLGAVPDVVLTDPTRARQILINLVGNAIKFTEHGEVRIVVQVLPEANEAWLQFDVMDTGIGISAEHIARLFRPFSQASASIGRTHGGTGLGLVISKRLAEMLGGDINVASSPGQGSTFRVTLSAGPLEKLPRLALASEVAAGTNADTDDPSGAKVRITGHILLAEDSPDNQRVINFFLKKAGARVTIVDNGRAALDAYLATLDTDGETIDPYDCVLLDIDMPVLNGFETARQLRLRGYRGPLLALTAHAMVHEVQRCLDAGFNCHVAKPINWSRLLNTIAKLIDSRGFGSADGGAG